ncbi:MAG TPA: sigma-54-dependent Fis family transcriptional regulator, partial [Bacteroidetes bacterium]|nr:sigma-54-dependent Fis family transcriptional regulator [Bacteroidota bacterium]
LETGETVLTENAREDPRFAGSTSIVLHDIRSVAAVPLHLGEEALGALYLDSRLGNPNFSESSLPALNLFGALAAQALNQALALKALRRENVRLRRQAGRYAFEEILGRSKAMETVFALMERVAPTDLPVLIRGESGTGKELIARAIHNAGPRRDKPLLALFAGNLGEELLESELFGHRKGAFTGAYQDKPGLLTLADGGSLLLDEVADIPPRIQAKLLRVLQDGTFKPVGGTGNLRADVRLLSATHSDLAERVRKGDFREDLYYRINGIEIEVPPLRNRREDIPLIAEQVLRRFCEESGRGRVRFSRAALALLVRARWPGNVRELERTVQRAVVLCPGDTIEPEHLVFTRSASGVEHPGERTLKAAEKRHILEVLRETGGNRSEAARLLGVSRRYLQKLIREWREEGLEV